MGRNAFKDLRPKMQRTGPWQDRLDGKNFNGQTPEEAAKQRAADRAAEDAQELKDERARDAAAPRRVVGMREHDDTAALLERLERIYGKRKP